MILLRLCVLAALAVSLAACAEPPLPPPTTVMAPPQARPETLQWAIESALAEHGWTVSSRGPGFVVAGVHSEGTNEGVTIQITHGGGTIQISRLNGSVTPQRYDRWVRLLTTAINRYAAGTPQAGVR
jgi:hypothetical protein